MSTLQKIKGIEEFYVGMCGSGHIVFGERVKLRIWNNKKLCFEYK